MSNANVFTTQNTPTASLEKARRKGRWIITALICILGVVAVIAAGVSGNDQVLTLPIALAICALGFAAHYIQDKIRDLAFTVAMVSQTALITGAFQGHAWQLDSHMIYFASLAMLVLLLNPVALFVGAGLIALHHGLLSLTLPTLVYPSTEVLPSLFRTAFHGAIVVLEASVLIWSVRTRLRMVKLSAADHEKMRHAAEEIAAAKEAADAAHAEALSAQSRAETEATKAQNALSEAQAQTARSQEIDAAKRLADEEHTTIQKAANDALEFVLEELTEALAGLAAKNLDPRLQTPFPEAYEGIRQDYNSAVSSLTDAISSVATQIQKIRGNAAAIAATSKDQSARSEARSQSLAKVSDSVRDLEASVTLVASNAVEASETVKISQNHADEGVRIVAEAVAAMHEIDDSANEIRQIVSLIEDIAFQTNLLALNAGVEAARAGDAGRGFAVVATEVRALAQRSSDSANEIRSLISKSDLQVKNGVSLVQKSGSALEQILGTVGQTNEQVDGINVSVQEQNNRLAVIAKTLEQLTTSAQNDSAMIEETAHASATLNESTDILSDAISVFKTIGQAAEDTFPADKRSAA